MSRKRIHKKPIIDGDKVIGFAAVEKPIKILVCNKAEADKLVIEHHYSHKATKNSFLSFLVYYNDVVSGVLQLGYGIRPKKMKGGHDSSETREFDRMWLSDDMPKFSETIVLSLMHHYIKMVYPEIKYIVSYADTTVGNTGTIYRAANYKFIEAIKADLYILADGERVHPVTMWHRHKTRKWDVLTKIYPGISKPKGKQLKFIYEL